MPRSWASGYLSTSSPKAVLMSTSMRLPINACVIWASKIAARARDFLNQTFSPELGQVVPPTPDRLERVLASASSAFEERFCTETVGHCARDISIRTVG